MGNTVAIFAFGVAAAALAVAGFVVLLRRTVGLPARRRVGAMARLAGTAVWAVLPPGRAAASVAAGLLAFAVCWAAGSAVTLFVVWLIPPLNPNPTEAYEGIGDAIMAKLYLAIGAAVSFWVAAFVGVAVGWRLASRMRAGSPHRASAL